MINHSKITKFHVTTISKASTIKTTLIVFSPFLKTTKGSMTHALKMMTPSTKSIKITKTSSNKPPATPMKSTCLKPKSNNLKASTPKLNVSSTFTKITSQLSTIERV